MKPFSRSHHQRSASVTLKHRSYEEDLTNVRTRDGRRVGRPGPVRLFTTDLSAPLEDDLYRAIVEARDRDGMLLADVIRLALRNGLELQARRGCRYRCVRCDSGLVRSRRERSRHAA